MPTPVVALNRAIVGIYKDKKTYHILEEAMKEIEKSLKG
jgi:hypothetical protein